MSKAKRYHWSDDTKKHFEFMNAYVDSATLLQSIRDFVEIDCTLEDGDTEEDLVNDLYQQVQIPWR